MMKWRDELQRVLACSQLKINHKKEIVKLHSLKEAHIYCKVHNLSGQSTGPLIENYIQNRLNLTKIKASSCKGDLEILEEQFQQLFFEEQHGRTESIELTPPPPPPPTSQGKKKEKKEKKEKEEKEEKKEKEECSPRHCRRRQSPQQQQETRNIEIKVSNGGQNMNEFNFVQIRMNHDCDYILTAYYLSEENLEQDGEMFCFFLNKEDMISVLIKHGSYAHGTKGQNGEIKEEDFWTLLVSQEGGEEDKKKKIINMKNPYSYALRPTYNDECWKTLMQFRKKNCF